MNKISKSYIHIGSLFSDGNNQIFEVVNYWFTSADVNKVLVKVLRFNSEKQIECIMEKEIDISELHPLSANEQNLKLIQLSFGENHILNIKGTITINTDIVEHSLTNSCKRVFAIHEMQHFLTRIIDVPGDQNL